MEQNMQVTINGKLEEVQAGTVLEVLKHKEVDPHMVAVELNAHIVERDQLETTSIKDGDKLEFLFFMGGGK